MRYGEVLVSPTRVSYSTFLFEYSLCAQEGISHVPEFIDPRFRENKPKTLERFGLVFAKTGSIISGKEGA